MKKAIIRGPLKKYAEISELILSHASDFKENPKCKTYFITTGVINEDANINAVVKSSQDGLKSYNLFESIEPNVDVSTLFRTQG